MFLSEHTPTGWNTWYSLGNHWQQRVTEKWPNEKKNFSLYGHHILLQVKAGRLLVFPVWLISLDPVSSNFSLNQPNIPWEIEFSKLSKEVLRNQNIWEIELYHQQGIIYYRLPTNLAHHYSLSTFLFTPKPTTSKSLLNFCSNVLKCYPTFIGLIYNIDPTPDNIEEHNLDSTINRLKTYLS